MFITQMKSKEHKSIKTRTFINLICTLPSESDDLPNFDNCELQVFFKVVLKPSNDRNIKCWGKGENGISTQLVLSMRPYVHIS